MIPETIKDGLHRAPTDRLPSDRLIVALDFPDTRAALALVDRLHGATRWFKVGLELYIAEGNSLVAELKRRGYSIFLDLKLHDIPNTVASAVRAATRLGVDMLTVHAAGGPEMITAAVGAAESRTFPAGSYRPDQHGCRSAGSNWRDRNSGCPSRTTGNDGSALRGWRIRLLPERGGELAEAVRQRALAGDPGDPS